MTFALTNSLLFLSTFLLSSAWLLTAFKSNLSYITTVDLSLDDKEEEEEEEDNKFLVYRYYEEGITILDEKAEG
jgi:hypothetical protein